MHQALGTVEQGAVRFSFGYFTTLRRGRRSHPGRRRNRIAAVGADAHIRPRPADFHPGTPTAPHPVGRHAYMPPPTSSQPCRGRSPIDPRAGINPAPTKKPKAWQQAACAARVDGDIEPYECAGKSHQPLHPTRWAPIKRSTPAWINPCRGLHVFFQSPGPGCTTLPMFQQRAAAAAACSRSSGL